MLGETRLAGGSGDLPDKVIGGFCQLERRSAVSDELVVPDVPGEAAREAIGVIVAEYSTGLTDCRISGCSVALAGAEEVMACRDWAIRT